MRPQSSELERDQTRLRIVQAAEKLFRSYGYAKTTVADIAAELAMSPANIYRFFKNKQSINEALASLMLGDAERQLGAIVAASESAAERLVNFIELSCQLTIQRYQSDHKVHDIVLAALSESWDVVYQHLNSVVAMLARIIGEGISSGEFPQQDAQASALCVHAAMAPFTHPVLVAQCSQSAGYDALPAQARLVGEFCLVALRAGYRPKEDLLAKAGGGK